MVSSPLSLPKFSPASHPSNSIPSFSLSYANRQIKNKPNKLSNKNKETKKYMRNAYTYLHTYIHTDKQTDRQTQVPKTTKSQATIYKQKNSKNSPQTNNMRQKEKGIGNKTVP